jgi:hypothetical protein
VAGTNGVFREGLSVQATEANTLCVPLSETVFAGTAGVIESVAVSEPAPVTVTSPPVEEKRPRGRPKKAPLADTAATEVTLVVASLGSAPDKSFHKASDDVATTEVLTSDLILCINRRPSCLHEDLTNRIVTVARELAEIAGVKDIRLSNNEQLAFGKWQGALVQAILEKPPQGWCAVYNGDLANPVIEALAAIAKVVIR